MVSAIAGFVTRCRLRHSLIRLHADNVTRLAKLLEIALTLQIDFFNSDSPSFFRFYGLGW